MSSRFLQFPQMRMAYVMEGRIILKYKSRSSRLIDEQADERQEHSRTDQDI